MSSRRGRTVVVILVAAAEMVLRLAEVVYAPFYALFLVGPPAMIIEMVRTGRLDRASVEQLPRPIAQPT
jgi:hypothetical protein